MTSLNPLPRKQNPLSVILTSSGMDVVLPGSHLELGVTVHNVGDRSALIYVFIEERTPKLRQWCGSMQERLALAPDQSGEVTFQIQVPTSALPEILEYDLIVDGSDSYQDFPPRRYDHYQLQILPTARAVGGTEEPTFHLEPVSSSRQPLVIQPGISQPLQVWVDNRAERVDRFRLSCLGLPEDWQVNITYPTDTQGYGLVIEADSLGLNPGERGQILVVITPPSKALANIYIPTLRLISENQPVLNLLDLVYLQVNPTYQLQPLLQTLRNQVRTQPALFEIQLNNLGNTPRDLLLTVQNLEDPDSCTYTLEPEQITLNPQQTNRVVLRGEPQKWWQRPFYGGGRFFNFRILLEDPDKHPIAVDTLPGNLLWLPRPWWQLLLLVITALAILGGFLGLIWWLFFRPPVFPQILAFAAGDSRYAEANGEFARVNWEVDHFHQVEALTLTGFSPEGEIISSPLIYTFEQGDLPQALIPFCTEQARVLTCNNVRTNASQPGTYVFEFTVTPKGRRPRRPITETSSNVIIEPQPLLIPEIVEFLPSRTVYQEIGISAATNGAREEEETANRIDPNGIRLNWAVTNPGELAALKLEARKGGDQLLGELWFEFERDETGQIVLPELLEEVCQVSPQVLICQELPTQIFQVGTYQFVLTAVARNAPDDPEAEPIVFESEPVTIQEITPAIAQFRISIPRLQIENENVRPKYLIPVSPGDPPPAILLTWAIRGGSTTRIELLPTPGEINALEGEAVLPLNPAGSTLITLQATNQAGETAAQSVQLETFDPDPQDPAEATAAAVEAAVKATAAAAAEQQQQDDRGENAAGGEGAAENNDSLGRERIAPQDGPPQFD